MKSPHLLASGCSPDISVEKSDILGLEVGHDTPGDKGVVLRVEKKNHRHDQHKVVVKLRKKSHY